MDPEDQFLIAECPSTLTTIREIIAYHKANNQWHRDQDINNACIFIVDRKPVAEHGIIHVKLDYNGAPDAFYAPLYECTGLASHNPTVTASYGRTVANSIWYGERAGATSKEEERLRPYHAFAVYDLLPASITSSDKRAFNMLLLLLEGGLHYNELTELKDLNPQHTVPYRNIYFAAPGRSRIIEEIKTDHPALAAERGHSRRMFVVVDGEYKDKGLLFVRLGGGEQRNEDDDEFRHRGPKAGELLNWIWSGFMSWEEAKAEETLGWPEGVEERAWWPLW